MRGICLAKSHQEKLCLNRGVRFAASVEGLGVCGSCGVEGLRSLICVMYRYGTYCSRDVLTSVNKATVFTVVATKLDGRRAGINHE